MSAEDTYRYSVELVIVEEKLVRTLENGSGSWVVTEQKDQNLLGCYETQADATKVVDWLYPRALDEVVEMHKTKLKKDKPT